MGNVRQRNEYLAFLLEESTKPSKPASNVVSHTVASAIAKAAERTTTEVTPDVHYRTSAASTGIPAVATVSVRDRMRIEQETQPRLRPKTAREKLIDEWQVYENSIKERDAAADQRKKQAKIDRLTAEKSAADARTRRGILKFEQGLLDSMFETNAATADEKREVNGHIAKNQPENFGNVDVHWAALMTLRGDGRL